MKKELIKKIISREIQIGIIGLGYVGLPLVNDFLSEGFRIIGFDTDQQKVNILNSGKNYIKHIETRVIKSQLLSGNFFATADMSRLNETDFIIICVPSPIGEHYEPDLSYIIDTATTISKYLRKGHTVILESTTYPGTTEEVILPILEKSELKAGIDFYLGFSPEREDPGNKEFSTKTIPKIVSGYSAAGLDVIKTLYGSIIDTINPVRTTKVAESAKLLENIYRAVNIALVNELKTVFSEMNIDIGEVIDAASTKPFGFQPFYPGPGIGGHCIPVDPFYLTWKAREFGKHTRFIELAGEINNSMPEYVLNTTVNALNSRKKAIKGAKILVLGIAYKPDIDDMRESPALKLIDLLLKSGAVVSFNDPFFAKIPQTRKYNFDICLVELTSENIKIFDAVVIVTNHTEFDYDLILSSSSLIIDTRNVYKTSELRGDKIWKG